jgi:hypothetical protein
MADQAGLHCKRTSAYHGSGQSRLIGNWVLASSCPTMVYRTSRSLQRPVHKQSWYIPNTFGASSLKVFDLACKRRTP